jgi:hypothetical protein
MQMPDRNGGNNEYRYGYGGHEKDDEVSGQGNHLAFGDYGYNPRLGRRFNIDPMIGSFPWMSPYATFNNNPIYFADPTGLAPEGASKKDEPASSDENSLTSTSQTKVSDGPGPRVLDLGLFTLTYSKRKYGGRKGTGNSLFGFRIDFKFRIGRETKPVVKTETFKINKYDPGASQGYPNTGNYPPNTIGTATNKSGVSLSTISNPSIEKAEFKTHVNDNGGDSRYKFDIGTTKVETRNGHRRVLLDPTTVSPSTTINGGMTEQEPGDKGFYDSCDGYKVKLKVTYQTRVVTRLKFLRVISKKTKASIDDGNFNGK